MRMKSKFDDRPILHLTFLDHCTGALKISSPIESDAFGILIKEDDVAYYLGTWICGKDLKDMDNNEVIVVLKSTVSKKRRLK